MTKDNGFNVDQVYGWDISFSSTFFLGSLTTTNPPTRDGWESIYGHFNHKLFSPCKRKILGTVMHKHEVWKYCHIFMYWYKGCWEAKCFWELPFPFPIVSQQCPMSDIRYCKLVWRERREKRDHNVDVFFSLELQLCDYMSQIHRK